MSMTKLPAQVTLVEVGPRDGLQNEKMPISTAIKIDLCKQLIEAGIHRLEAAAFVSPKWVPQMADGADVLAGLQNLPELQDRTVSYSALVPNLKGMEAAIEAGVQEAVVFTAASEAFTQKKHQLHDCGKYRAFQTRRRVGPRAQYSFARLYFMCSGLPVSR